ncbi:MAG: hypothetical protein A3E07_00235 [Candidatus Wildermuthbacteria bacterium RIFCSPHIGHO2_12_FULL_45_9]|uniref:ATP-grasp domain-containing protein n=1 Tax=Candidatus Wildermuthbacteria bacterium RIFCSPHIGHO2_02_FULL_45_25 TaxID=1802450 RepID=A0A1G2QZE5_9BACT|nr:MAG: hypothetical protein A3C04_02320 [Candidatus Wildermuthbacteria bacterium RIFCSPHIGHO2_02_FULL_45_25]OHA70685.1 MAG: hypothetical protein A3E07_00235 [Candidatus Wildermuthbacteria bacterium RIFCSPHIGHO2_12_FULL_45_9]
MAQNGTMTAKDIILIVGLVDKAVAESILATNKQRGWNYRFGLMYSTRPLSKSEQEVAAMFDIQIPCNFDSHKSITQALLPYEGQLKAATVRGENNIPYFQKVIPHIPYLRTPTTESLTWATSKIEMRTRFSEYDKTVSPIFKVVSDAHKKTLESIKTEIGFPLVIKPAGLAASLLVTIAYHEEELAKSLRRVLRKLRSQYKKWEGRGEPQVLVEQFMEGEMYSIDCYVSSSGKIYYCPLVHVKTGRSIGFDDFFGYQRITPTLLTPENIQLAQETAKKAIYGLGLRSSTAHIELMKTENGWKIIELGPRIGGFRDTMYLLSFDISHTANDIAIHLPEKPVISHKQLGYTAALQFFAKHEGKITNLVGIKKIKNLNHFIPWKST